MGKLDSLSAMQTAVTPTPPPPKFAGDLIDAAVRGNTAAVQALLAEGANVNAKANDGMTALMKASQEGNREVVQALLDKGAEVSMPRPMTA